MDVDTDRIDEAVLALMHLGMHYNNYTWKGFDHDAMKRLYEKGFIDFPFGKTKSVMLTETGARQSKELFTKLFANKTTRIRPMEEDFAAHLAKTIVLYGLRNALLEELHSGKDPVSETGDFSDVKVVTPEGDIPWVRTEGAKFNKLARLNNDEMRTITRGAVNTVYTILRRLDNFDQLVYLMKHALAHTEQWDDPEELTDWSTGSFDKIIQEPKENR